MFNLKMGFGTREHDYPPYRAVGPVTIEEYESRAERYDQQLMDEVGVDPGSLSTEEKMKRLREYRENRYEKLVDAVYARRGWNDNGIPALEKLQELGIDYPDVVALVEGQD
jgi:aldehyde:ferredoxin oxidoreductase